MEEGGEGKGEKGRSSSGWSWASMNNSSLTGRYFGTFRTFRTFLVETGGGGRR